MGMDDKLKNSAEGTLGKAKEALGGASDDESLEREGKREQSKSDLKQAGEKVKDAFNK
ncbi:MAG: CsbD family protein [Actinomycetota bacterium]